jgi:hypothetical protein
VEEEVVKQQQEANAQPLNVQFATILSRRGMVRIEEIVQKFKGVDARGQISKRHFREGVLSLVTGHMSKEVTADEVDAWFEDEQRGGKAAAAAAARLSASTRNEIDLPDAIRTAKKVSAEFMEREAAARKALAGLRRAVKQQQASIRAEAADDAIDAKNKELEAQRAKKAHNRAVEEAEEAKKRAREARKASKQKQQEAFAAKVEQKRRMSVEPQKEAKGGTAATTPAVRPAADAAGNASAASPPQVELVQKV